MKSQLEKSMAGVLFGLLATSGSQVVAQVDSTGVRQLTGTPRLAATAGGGGGATILPFQLPSGTYRNAAPYPLSLSVGVGNEQQAELVVNGRVVASDRVRDSGTWGTMTGIVPAGATFTFNTSGRGGGSPATVTALANGATWQQTSIRFAVDSGVYVATPVDNAPLIRNVFDCRFNFYDSDWNLSIVNAVLFEGSPCSSSAWTLFSNVAGSLKPSFVPNTDTSTNRYARGGTVRSGVYSRNVNEGRGVCNAELRQGDNWGSTTTTWSGQFPYPAIYTASGYSQEFTRQLCIPSAIENIRNTGLPLTPPPPPYTYEGGA